MSPPVDAPHNSENLLNQMRTQTHQQQQQGPIPILANICLRGESNPCSFKHIRGWGIVASTRITITP